MNTKSSFGVAQIILFLSIAILVVVVAFPVLLILFNAFWVSMLVRRWAPSISIR